jgi:hypothetical protein
VLAGALLAAFTVSAAPNAFAQMMQPPERRWDLAEKDFAQKNMAEKIGTNVRDGFVGIFDSLGQGLFSGMLILSPYGGIVLAKVSTLVGDVVGLVDNNPATKHVTNGFLSRHFLRLGSMAARLPNGLNVIHDMDTMKGPKITLNEYIGPQYFHTDAYLTHSVFASTGAVIVSDILIRPAGSFITIFGFRDQGQKMDEMGLGLIDDSLDARFP